MDGEQDNPHPYRRWGHEKGSYAQQQPSLVSPQSLAGGNHHHQLLYPQPTHHQEDGCRFGQSNVAPPQYSCYKTDEPSPTLMASLLHLVDGDAPSPSPAAATTFSPSAQSSSFFPTSTTSSTFMQHPYSCPPALQQQLPFSATSTDDQEWDEVVAYLSRQPWPATLPPQLQELTTSHEAHYPAALITTPPASGTNGRRAAVASSSSSSSPILLGPQLAPQAYDHYQQTPYDHHPDHHLWMHSHARHATTSPAAGGQQRNKRRHRGSDNTARDGWAGAPTTCSSSAIDGYAPRDGAIGVNGSRRDATVGHGDLFDGFFSPADAAALYDERASLQLITPTAATASRLHQATTSDQGEGEEEEDSNQAGEGALQPYSRSALQRPSKALSKAALGRNKARRIWTEDAHLRLAAMGLCYLDTYRKKVWVYATIHPSAMIGDNVRSSLERGFDGWTSKEEATLGVSVLMVLAQGAAQAGDKKMAKEFFMKARQAAVYVGSDSSDYTLAEALVSIAIFAHIEGEMDDREMHQILDKAMQICRRVPALNSDAYHRCMFMKSILHFTSPSDMKMLDEAFCSVKQLPYYTYFVDGQTREVMPYGMSVMRGIADTAIVLFHVIIALEMKNHGYASGCAAAGSHHMDNDIIQLVRTVLSLEVRLETIAKDWPPFMYLSLRLCAIASRAQCFWMLGLQRQAYKCIEDYIQLSQKRKQDSSFEFLGPPVLRADQTVLSILAEKDDGELVSEMFDAMKINEEKMPGLRKLRERYNYLLDRKPPQAAAAANGSSFASFPSPSSSSSSRFHPAVASSLAGAQHCSGPAPPQTSPATVCPPFSPAAFSDFPSPPSSSRATHLSSAPPASSPPASGAVPPLAGKMPAEPPAVTSSPPRQPVDTLLFGRNVPAAAATSHASSPPHSTSSDDATSAAAPSRLLEPQNAELFAELQRKERDMTALEQRMYKVRAKTQNLDERIESLEELVAIYETIVTTEDADTATAAKDQSGAATKQERRNGSTGRPRRDARGGKAGKPKTKCGARGYDVERADAHLPTSLELLGSPCASSSSSPPSQTTSSSPVMSPSQQLGGEGGAVPSRLMPSSSSSSLSSSSSAIFPSSPELVLTDKEFFREIFALGDTPYPS